MKIKMAVLATLLALFCGATAQAAFAQTETMVFNGSAYGTEANVGHTVLSGKTAFVILDPCSTQFGQRHTNSVDSVNQPPLFTTGAIHTIATNSKTSSQTRADVQQASAVSGLITADEIRAVSSTTLVNGNLQVSADGSAFTNLVVAGEKIQGTPAPNTKVDLPGLGYVILNEEITKTEDASAKLIVNMIHVFVTQSNGLNIPKGAQIVVADAHSGIQLAQNGALDGFAFGSRANIGSKILSGRSAIVYMPCLGTDGEVLKNTTTGVNINHILTTGTVTDTAQGTISSSSTTGETTSTVSGSILVSKILTAKVIKADANASTENGSHLVFSDMGSKFVGLKVAGHPNINDDVPPNTRVQISGLGTLWLHRVIRSHNYIEVRMVELVVTKKNTFGIGVGTDVRVAESHVSLDTNK